ncbi:MAG: ankyrin repeat domain-containing protein [Chthonomonadales bacterium]
MQILIDHGADVNGENKNDPRPIILAIQNQQIESVKFLIEHEANVNMTRGDNNSPIWEATVTGNNFALQLLLKAGADPVKCGTSFEQLIDVAQKDYRDETAAILKDAMAKRKAAGSGGLKK